MDNRADAVVVFGATGDLAYKKLFPALYHLAGRGRLGVPVIGVGRSAWDDRQLAAAARKAVEEADGKVKSADFDEFASHLTMVTGHYADPGLYERLARRLRGAAHPLFHLAVPPTVFDDVTAGLAAAGLAARGRVVVEKPFGHDARSSRELEQRLRSAFAPERIFRIDHYLGKESVEGLLAFRFANGIFEPLWNREHIARIEVTLAEEFGTQGRAGFYDAAGAIRDVLQNHVLQTVALLAMEPPATTGDVQREATEVLRRIRPLSPETTVRGQYAGYRDEPGVAPDSTTETFVATRLAVDAPRWNGVPVLLRAGKHLPITTTEAVIELRRPGRPLFTGRHSAQPEANLVRLRLGRDEGVTITVQAKTPGPEALSHPVDLSLEPDTTAGTRQEAYERLLDDAMDGRHHRFVPAEAIEEQWRIVEPVLDIPERPAPYPRGSWGPARADLLAGGWHQLHRVRHREAG